jgi:hypothetical protein
MTPPIFALCSADTSLQSLLGAAGGDSAATATGTQMTGGSGGFGSNNNRIANSA